MTLHPLNATMLREISNRVAQSHTFPCPLNIERAFSLNTKDGTALANEQISLSGESKKRKSADAIIVTTEYIKLKRCQRTAPKSFGESQFVPKSITVHVEKDQEHFVNNFKSKLNSMINNISPSHLDIDSEIVSLLQMPSTQMEKAINELEIFNFGDDIFQRICQRLCDMEGVTYQNTVIFLQGTLLSKLNGLDANPSRELTVAALEVARSKSKAMIDGLLNPLIHSPEFGKPHLEVVNRIIKEGLNNASRLDLLKSILNQRQLGFTDISVWNELVIGVLQTILGLDVILDAETVSRLVTNIGKDIDVDPKSKLLPQVLITLLNKHGTQSIGCLKQIVEITNRSESFMKRTILKSVQQLEKNGMCNIFM